MDSKVVRADFGSGLICPRTHTCCALKSSAPSGARQDNYADSGSACKLAGVQIIPLPTLANQILARTFFRSVANLIASPAVGKFSRASSAGGRLNLRSNIEQPDRVGRRGLSEPREDFSRLNTYAFPWLYPGLDSVAHLFACQSAGKFSRASSAVGLTPRVHCKEGRDHCHSQHESRERLL